MAILLWSAMLLFLLLFPGISASAARQAMVIWGLDVVPSLFPFMVLCRMLAARMSACSLPAIPTVIALGLIGGSPSGASAFQSFGVHSESRGGLTCKDILPLCALMGTISPMFFLGTLSSWLNNPQLGRMVMTAHYGGAILCAAFVKYCPAFSHIEMYGAASAAASGQNPIMQSIDAILHVGGCIIFYSVAAGLLKSLPIIPEMFGALMHALLEAAGGMHALTMLSLPSGTLSLLLAGVSGFSGLSILSQNLFFLSPFGVKLHHLLIFGALRALFSALIMAPLCLI